MSARPLLHDETSAPPIQRLGKYEIVGVLGEGAMGIVYNAIDPHINRRVAVKAIRAPLLGEAAQDLSAALRFRTEAQAAGRLSHPNIVSIYEYGEVGDERYIAMEYVSGVSLHELIAHGRRLPLDDVASVMLQLLDALECAHEQGVWHRDIKPANLLITADGRLKVTDFGIARIESSDLTLPSSALGSSGYMAPERYTGVTPDCRVDIFSCGVLLYQLLTGRTPYRGSSSEVMYQVLHDTPPAPSTLAIDKPPPPRFDALVARAIAMHPEERYASAAQMRDALREAAGRPIAPTVSTQTMVRPRPNSADAPTELIVRGTPSVPQPPSVPHASNASIPPSIPSTPHVSATPTGALHDDALLAAIEALLVGHLGPVARLVVRDAARRSTSVHALVERIAAEALDADERDAFIRSTRALLPAQPPAGAHPPAADLPVLGSTPMTADVVPLAQRVLAEQIGPIAKLLVRRAAAGATSREQFFTALADQAGDDVDRKQLLEALWRIG